MAAAEGCSRAGAPGERLGPPAPARRWPARRRRMSWSGCSARRRRGRGSCSSTSSSCAASPTPSTPSSPPTWPAGSRRYRGAALPSSSSCALRGAVSPPPPAPRLSLPPPARSRPRRPPGAPRAVPARGTLAPYGPRPGGGSAAAQTPLLVMQYGNWGCPGFWPAGGC